MRLLLCILVAGLAGKTTMFAQNLIPNPSFEQVQGGSNRWAGVYNHFDRQVMDWDSPTQGSPDILKDTWLGKMFPKRPGVDLSQHQVRSGHYMVGIKTFGCATNTLFCKEYIQVQLHQPLQPCVQYEFECWIQPVHSSVRVNGLGIAVSATRIKDIMEIGILDIPALYIDTTLIDPPNNQWYRLHTTFEVETTAQYLILGSFLPDEQIPEQIRENGIDYGYHLIDDLSLKVIGHCPDRKQQVTTLQLPDILFDFGKYHIRPAAQQELQQIVQQLKEMRPERIEIHGHTDNIGTPEKNQELSEQRAQAIKSFLIREGLDAGLITLQGFGSSKPRQANISSESRQQNRRVELVLYLRE
jgi:OOP family OmpA-OmpF porin